MNNTITRKEGRNLAFDALKSIVVCLIAVFHLFGWNGISNVVPMSLYLGQHRTKEKM